jgi:hypothetical protein
MTGTLTVTNSAGTSGQLLLQNPASKNGQFQFTISGKAGNTHVTETSRTFTNWLAISTNRAPADKFTVTDPQATNGLGFYRVRLGP